MHSFTLSLSSGSSIESLVLSIKGLSERNLSNETVRRPLSEKICQTIKQTDL